MLSVFRSVFPSSLQTRSVLYMILALALPLLGCTALFDFANIPSPDGTPPPSNAEAQPVMRVTFQGGHCVYGACFTQVTLFDDGTYRIEDGGGAKQITSVSDEDLAAIVEAIEAADFEAMRSVPFTDICPVAYDGNEIIYTFYTSYGSESLSSCEYVLDERYPLIAAVNALLAEYGQSAR